MQTDSWATSWSFDLIGAWFTTTVISITFATVLILYLSLTKTLLPVSQNFKLYMALPPQTSEVSDSISSSDGREVVVTGFFKSYHSDLADYSSQFIIVADKYHLDFRLLPAIAMQESNGGKKVVNNSFNPFGFGIYGGKVIKFSSWEEAIEKVGKALREDYLDEGLKTPEQIMAKYTPPSLEKGGSWAKGVKSFMEELR